MQATNMYIRMEGMKFYAFHGVMPQENLVGANFYVDLKLKTDFTSAAQTDKLEGTVSYPPNYWNMFANALPYEYSRISQPLNLLTST